MGLRTERILTRTPFKTLELPGNYMRLALEARWKVEQNRFRAGVRLEVFFDLFYLGLLVPDKDNGGKRVS